MNYSFNNSEYVLGKINSNKIGDFKNLDYIFKSFNDENTVKKWKSIGHNYEKYTGYMRDGSNIHPDWCYEIAEDILKNSSITLYCMTPGSIMPEHSDMFYKYRELNNLSLSDDIYRIVVFLENWKSGHYLEINKNPIINWKKGDYVMWKNQTPHIAANIGDQNRYTMQITGVVDQSL